MLGKTTVQPHLIEVSIGVTNVKKMDDSSGGQQKESLQEIVLEIRLYPYIPGSSKYVKFAPFHPKKTYQTTEFLHIWKIQVWVFSKMVVPNQPMGFPTENDHFGVEIGGTAI